jgi:hypothetical protein
LSHAGDDYFSEIQSLIRSSIFVENVDVEYEVKLRGIGIVHGILGMLDGHTVDCVSVTVAYDEFREMGLRR